MAQDDAQANIAKYKAGLRTKAPSDFVKHTPMRIVPGYSAELLATIGLKQNSYPTPKKSQNQ